jgi:FkbM family methyltransferase
MQATEVASNGFRWIVFEGDMISDSLRLGKGWEPHFADVARRFIKSASTVIDAGANFGYHTLELARIVGASGKVIAFEPQRIIFQQLCTNIFLNGVLNVWAFPWAVAQEFGTCPVPGIHQTMQGNLGATPLGWGSETVQLVPLDKFIDEQISFIKIDIQGAETACLRGASELIAQHRPILFLEIEEHWLRRLSTSSKELIEELFALDYALFRIETDYPTDFICFHKSQLQSVSEALRGFPWALTLLTGKHVELSFVDKPYWQSFEITA